MANQPYQIAIDELSSGFIGTAIDVELGRDADGNYGFIPSRHRSDPIEDALIAMHVDSVREYAKRDAQALKMALNSLYGSFGAPTAVMPPNTHMSVVLLGRPAPAPIMVASKSYGPAPGFNYRSRIVPLAPQTQLLDPSKVKPNRRERRARRHNYRIVSGYRDRSAWMVDYRIAPRHRRERAELPWWRRLPIGETCSHVYARALADLGEIGIADPFTWSIEERRQRCAAAERETWRAMRHARLPEPRAPELRTRRGRACSIAGSYRLCPA
jgi:hypothetical protein